jgi:hypothetical protein
MTILKWMADDGISATPDDLTAISRDDLAAFLRTEFLFKQEETDRRERARQRHLFYNSGGDEIMERLVGSVFKDRDVIAKRTEWVKHAKYNNVLRRIVNELSTVYSEPARRSVGDKTQDEIYQAVLEAVSFDQVAIRFSRWLNLHRYLAVGFRVRTKTSGEREPVVDIVTPDRFWAVPHPSDRTRLVALIFELDSVGPSVSKEAKYLVWTDKETFRMSKDGHIMAETWREHRFERMPWVLASLEPPAGRLLDDMTNEDLTAAHRSVWFQNICLIKESKSATKIVTVSGDTTQAARNQAADPEMPVELGDGTAVGVIDMSMDLALFRDTARSIYETAAANYGLAPSLLTHQGVQSAEARELMRVPLHELRREQQVPLRRFEREFVGVMSMVLRRDLPAMAFDPDGWRIDFGESQTPLGPKAELEVFQQERQLGLTSTVKFKMRRNPDMDLEAAREEMAEDILLETERIEMLKSLMVASGEAAGDSRPQPGDEDPPPDDERPPTQ